MKTIQKKTASYVLKDGMLTIIQFSGSKIVGQVTVPMSDLKELAKSEEK